jgi:polysaccharide biosynthesis/export protein
MKILRRTIYWSASFLVPLIGSGSIWAQPPGNQNKLAAENSAIVQTSSSAGHDHTAGLPSAHDRDYVIGPGDLLTVSVWKEPDVSRVVPVRSDGRISIPLAGEVQASGTTPKELELEIATRLKTYIDDPEVTVIVQEIRSAKFNILGQVAKPGTYLLTDSTTVLDAIAMAGGFRDFAKQKSIYVLRSKPDGTREMLPFNYKQVIKGRPRSENVKLQAHDTVVVP